MDKFNWIGFLYSRIIELEKTNQEWRKKYAGDNSEMVRIKFILLEDAIELNTRLLASIGGGNGISDAKTTVTAHC